MLLLLLLLQLPMRFRSREDASGRRLHEALFCVAFPPLSLPISHPHQTVQLPILLPCPQLSARKTVFGSGR
jgi:hypothetical protein